MKRYKLAIPAFLVALFLIESICQAQSVTTQDQLNRYNAQIDRNREEERAQNLVRRRVATPNPNNAPLIDGAWWTDPSIVAELALTDDQKARIEKAFENHSRNIVADSGLLEKEEQQLARLLEADPIDHTGVLNQTNRVIQSRGEMERETSAMTLEMREQLSRTQWMKLQALETRSRVFRFTTVAPTPSPAPGGQRRQ